MPGPALCLRPPGLSSTCIPSCILAEPSPWDRLPTTTTRRGPVGDPLPSTQPLPSTSQSTVSPFPPNNSQPMHFHRLRQKPQPVSPLFGEINYRVYAEHKPSPGGKVAREAGRKRNSGDNLNCGIGKDLLAAYVFISLFRCTISKVSARIPLQSALRAASFPPGLRPQARFVAQPPKAALSAELSATTQRPFGLLLLILFLQEQEKNRELW